MIFSAQRRFPLALLVLRFAKKQQCGAFVVPSAVRGRASPASVRLGIQDGCAIQQRQRVQVPNMVLSGLPSPTTRRQKKDAISDQSPPKTAKKASTWNDDLPTTLGRAAFSSLKDKARDMMVKGAEKRGLDWTGIVERLQVMRNKVVVRRKRVTACWWWVMIRSKTARTRFCGDGWLLLSRCAPPPMSTFASTPLDIKRFQQGKKR